MTKPPNPEASIVTSNPEVIHPDHSAPDKIDT